MNNYDSPSSEEKPKIIPSKDHLPCCIVWCPIPMLTWLFPFIGHMGICTSEGMIHDFAGPYFINRDKHKMGFGTATKYISVKFQDIQNMGSYSDPINAWDQAIEISSREYDQMNHNLILNNCHSHVARCLNRISYKGFTNWNTLFLIIYMAIYGEYVSVKRFLMTYAGFFVISCIIISIVLYAKVFS